MQESEYIFESGVSEFNIGIGIIVILIFIIINYTILLILSIKNERSKKYNYLLYIGLSIVFMLMVIHGSYSCDNFLKNLKSNLGITTGTTIKEEITDGADEIKYFYEINGKHYVNSCGRTYGGERILNILVPSGKYKVLYNTKDPSESIMDFKAPR